MHALKWPINYARIVLAKDEGAGQQAQEGGGDGGRNAAGTGGFVTDVATGATRPPPHT